MMVYRDDKLMLDPTDGWSIWSPAWQKASCLVRAVQEGLLVEAPGNPYAVGGIQRDLRGIGPRDRMPHTYGMLLEEPQITSTDIS